MGELKKWREQNWVRIGTDGEIKGPCGTSKDKKNPDRCLPKAKAQSLTKSQRASTARKKKKEGAKGKTNVKNTKAAEVKFAAMGGEITYTKAKRPAPKKMNGGGVVARGCGAILSNRRKKTKGSVSAQEKIMAMKKKKKAKGYAKGGKVKRMMKGGAAGGKMRRMMKGGAAGGKMKRMAKGGAMGGKRAMGMMGGGAPMTMAQLRAAAKQKGMTLSPMKAAKGGAAKKKK